MTVTELAIIPLTHPLTQESPTLPQSLIAHLLTSKIALETASGHPFHFFQQIEDPSTIYILGTWDSVPAHHEFLTSPTNLELLKLLQDSIIPSTEEEKGEGKGMQMFHLETSIALSTALAKGEAVVEAPVVALGRYFVRTDGKEAFEGKFAEVRGVLEEGTRPFQVVGGWRVEKEGRGEEWCLFSGWRDVEQHAGFERSEGWVKYREILGLVDGCEVRHLRAIEGL